MAYQNHQILKWRISEARTRMQIIFSAIDYLGMTNVLEKNQTRSIIESCPQNILILEQKVEKSTYL